MDDTTIQIDAPGILLFWAEAEGMIGNLKLHAPAFVVDGGSHLPDAIPSAIEARIVDDNVVGEGARRSDGEAEAGLMVMVRVESDSDPVRLSILDLVSTVDASDDLIWLAVIASDGDIERLIVVGYLKGGLL